MLTISFNLHQSVLISKKSTTNSIPGFYNILLKKLKGTSKKKKINHEVHDAVSVF
jgi:hypothetical protein